MGKCMTEIPVFLPLREVALPACGLRITSNSKFQTALGALHTTSKYPVIIRTVPWLFGQAKDTHKLERRPDILGPSSEVVLIWEWGNDKALSTSFTQCGWLDLEDFVISRAPTAAHKQLSLSLSLFEVLLRVCSPSRLWCPLYGNCINFVLASEWQTNTILKKMQFSEWSTKGTNVKTGQVTIEWSLLGRFGSMLYVFVFAW